MFALGADPDPLVRLLDLRRLSTTTADAALCFAPSHALAELSQMETPAPPLAVDAPRRVGRGLLPSGVLAATYRDGPACLFDAARGADGVGGGRGGLLRGAAAQRRPPQQSHLSEGVPLLGTAATSPPAPTAATSSCTKRTVRATSRRSCAPTATSSTASRRTRRSPSSPRPGSSTRSSSFSRACHDPPTRAKPKPTPTAARRAVGERAPSALSDAGSSLGSSLYGDDDETRATRRWRAAAARKRARRRRKRRRRRARRRRGGRGAAAAARPVLQQRGER